LPRRRSPFRKPPRLVLYPTEERLEELDLRKRGQAGDEAHRRACEDCEQPSGFPRAVTG
jgi:hypothetical protein